jgi:protein-S-isoprenylcysteine O-methyltransferase
MSDSSASNSPGIIHEFPRDRIQEHINGNARADVRQMYIPPPYLPGGKRALSGISLRAHLLGVALGASTVLTVQMIYSGNDLWRAPGFIATLALFHYLEFDMTARYNTADASLSSFLLSSNGLAYAAAHTSAMLELFIQSWLYSSYAPPWLGLPFHLPRILPAVPASVSVAVGTTLIVLGQFTRSAAMRSAKANFNHVIQWTKRADHVLVTDGVYAFSRHPSYFGFFWWGLGTQVLLGNRICFVLYAIVLWKFFHHRIICKMPTLCNDISADVVTA